jgi:hypothetical protein
MKSCFLVHPMRFVKRMIKEIVREAVRTEFDNQTNLPKGARNSTYMVYRDDCTKLWDVEFKVYAQWSEDGIFDYLITLLDIENPKCLDIGAGDIRASNVRWAIEKFRGKGLFVDARSDLKDSLVASGLAFSTLSECFESWIKPSNVEILNSKVIDFFGREGFDVLSLDIDGQDYWVLSELSLTNVKIICLEYRAVFGRAPITVPMDDDFDRQTAHYSHAYYGASLAAFIKVLSLRDYTFLGSNSQRSNAFFVHNSIVAKIPKKIVEFSADIEHFLDCTIRESRDKSGNLNYLQPRELWEELKDLPFEVV